METKRLATDFCVIGGGMAGVCAAIAAARHGARVVLVQNRSVLGGNASSEIKMHICGANFCRQGARESGLIEELRLEDAARNPQRAYPLWDLLLYEKVKAAGVTLLLDTEFTSAKVEAGRIVSVRALRNSTEDEFEIAATYFADCSGDGRLGAEAGAEFRVGREARAEYGESIAPEQADTMTLGNSILFTAKKHDRPMPFVAPDWVRRFQKHEFKHRSLAGQESFEYGYWFAEWGGHLDTIKDGETIRHELLRIALGIWDYVKNSGETPNSANWALEWVGAVPGKRENRRLLGAHVLAQDDLMSGRLFPDQVAFGGWPIDLHPPRGMDAIDEPPCVHHKLPHLYSIPLRSLFSRNIRNLFFAGRNISATHVAFGSTRIMATCALVGQGIGTAAASGIRHKLTTAAPLVEAPLIGEIQQTLLRDDATLLGVPNTDAGDLARIARVSASSAQPGHEPASVLDGVTRSLKPEWGSWSDGASHQWRATGVEEWLELSWNKPVSLAEIHLTFDTGFERVLMLTPSDSLTRDWMIRGPQPETIKVYRLLADGKEVWREDNNHLRKRVHHFTQPIPVKTLRLEVLATHGAAEARLFEIRCYGHASSEQ